MRFIDLAAVLFLPSLALAHFTLDYPVAWFFDEDVEAQFCGGGNQSMAVRTSVSMAGDSIHLNSHHAAWTLGAFISFKNSILSYSDFGISDTPTSSSSPTLIPYFKGTGITEVCLDFDYSSLGLSTVSNDANATILVIYNGGDGNLYQCADITFSSSAASNNTCGQGASSATTTSFALGSATQTATGTNSPTATSTTSGSNAAFSGHSVGVTLFMAATSLFGFYMLV